MRALFYLRAALRLIGEEQQAKPLPQWWQELVQQYADDDETRRALEWFQNEFSYLLNRNRFAKVFRQYMGHVNLRALLELAANDPSDNTKYYKWMVELYRNHLGEQAGSYDADTVSRVITGILNYERWKTVMSVTEGEPPPGRHGVNDYIDYFRTLHDLESAYDRALRSRLPPRLLKRDIRREVVYPRPTKEEMQNAIVYRVNSYNALRKIVRGVLGHDVPAWGDEILGGAGNVVYTVVSRDRRYIYLVVADRSSGNIKAIYDSNNIEVYPNEEVYGHLAKILARVGIQRGEEQPVPAQQVFPGCIVYRVDNHEALCDIGGDTRWCTSSWSNPEYWDHYLSLYGGNTVYVVITDGGLRKYIVRVSNENNGIRIIRDRDDNPVLLDSEEYRYVVLALRKAGVAVEDRENYDVAQNAGAGWNVVEDQRLGAFAYHSSVIKAFGFFEAWQWNDIVHGIESSKGIRIVPSDLNRLTRMVLPTVGTGLADWMVGTGDIIDLIREYDDDANGNRKRQALISLIVNYARKHRLNNLYRVLRTINTKLCEISNVPEKRRTESARMVLLAHALSGRSIDNILQFLAEEDRDWLDYEGVIPLYAMIMTKYVRYVDEHYYDELQELEDDERVVGGTVYLSSTEESDDNFIRFMFAMAKWARALRWPERGVEHPEQELKQWIEIDIMNPRHVRILNDVLMHLQALDDVGGTRRRERMWRNLKGAALHNMYALYEILDTLTFLEEYYGNAKELIEIIVSDGSILELAYGMSSFLINDMPTAFRVLRSIKDIHDVLVRYGRWKGDSLIDISRIIDVVRSCARSSNIAESLSKVFSLVRVEHIDQAIDNLCHCLELEEVYPDCTLDQLLDSLRQFGSIEVWEDIEKFCSWLRRRTRAKRAAARLYAALAATM